MCSMAEYTLFIIFKLNLLFTTASTHVTSNKESDKFDCCIEISLGFFAVCQYDYVSDPGLVSPGPIIRHFLHKGERKLQIQEN